MYICKHSINCRKITSEITSLFIWCVLEVKSARIMPKRHKPLADSVWHERLKVFAETHLWPQHLGNRPAKRQQRWYALYQKVRNRDNCNSECLLLSCKSMYYNICVWQFSLTDCYINMSQYGLLFLCKCRFLVTLCFSMECIFKINVGIE